jgi:hypothetical protein
MPPLDILCMSSSIPVTGIFPIPEFSYREQILLVLVLGLKLSYSTSLIVHILSFCICIKLLLFSSYGLYTSFASGVSFEMQQRAIRSGVHILVATPGRALDHISRGTIDLSNVKHVVLDEVRSISLS